MYSRKFRWTHALFVASVSSAVACAPADGASGREGERAGDAPFPANLGTPIWSGSVVHVGQGAFGEVCLDVEGPDNGARVILADCNGKPSQEWLATNRGELYNPWAGRCMDAAPQHSVGDPLVLWDCWGGSNQLFSLGWGNVWVYGGMCLEASPEGVALNWCLDSSTHPVEGQRFSFEEPHRFDKAITTEDPACSFYNSNAKPPNRTGPLSVEVLVRGGGADLKIERVGVPGMVSTIWMDLGPLNAFSGKEDAGTTSVSASGKIADGTITVDYSKFGVWGPCPDGNCAPDTDGAAATHCVLTSSDPVLQQIPELNPCDLLASCCSTLSSGADKKDCNLYANSPNRTKDGPKYACSILYKNLHCGQ